MHRTHNTHAHTHIPHAHTHSTTPIHIQHTPHTLSHTLHTHLHIQHMCTPYIRAYHHNTHHAHTHTYTHHTLTHIHTPCTLPSYVYRMQNFRWNEWRNDPHTFPPPKKKNRTEGQLDKRACNLGTVSRGLCFKCLGGFSRPLYTDPYPQPWFLKVRTVPDGIEHERTTLKKDFFVFLLSVWVLCLNACMCTVGVHAIQCLRGRAESTGSPETETTDHC